MLLKLPKEIVFNILNFLTFQDRLNLVKTCHHLRNAISERHLYEELPTFKSESTLRNALDSFRKNPAYGSQVKRLNIRNILITNDISMQLPFAFPNIEEFRTPDVLWLIKESEINILSKWKDTLEVFHGGNKLGIAHVLNHNTFSRLSSLTMALPPTFFNIYEKKQRNIAIDGDTETINRIRNALTNHNILEVPSRTRLLNNINRRRLNKLAQHNRNLSSTDLNFQFFDCFKNTPSLKHLELTGGNLYVEYLEKLHAVCPQLTSLSLLSLSLYVGDIDELPSVIEPVTQLLSLKLNENTLIHNSRNRTLDYLIEKYTKLTELIFLGTDINRNDNFEESLRKKKEFLSSIPSTVKILKLNTDVFNDPIAILQGSALGLTEIAFYTTSIVGEIIPAAVVTHPKHFDYLKSLNSLKSLTLEWNSIMEDYSNGPISDSISHLTVQFPDNDMNNNRYALDNILLVYPSLKSLVVSKKTMVLNKTTPIPITIKDPFRNSIYPNLKQLSIDQPCLDQNVIDFIRAALPNLKELKLFYPLSDSDPDVLINLNGYNLDVFDLTPFEQIPDGTYITLYLQVTTLNELKNYKMGMVDSLEIRCITEPEEDKQNKKMVRIVCDNIEVLKINGMDIKPFLNYNR